MGAHVMVDIETLGTRPGSVILSIGAAQFSSGGVGRSFYHPVNVFSCLMAGLTIDPSTVQWWREQPIDVRAATQPGDTVSLRVALEAFAAFIGEGAYLWAKGPDFDLVLLAEAYHALGKTPPWSFRNTRDVRTISSIAGRLDVMPNLTRHHALHDAIHQAKTVIAAYAALGRDIDKDSRA